MSKYRIVQIRPEGRESSFLLEIYQEPYKYFKRKSFLYFWTKKIPCETEGYWKIFTTYSHLTNAEIGLTEIEVKHKARQEDLEFKKFIVKEIDISD